MGLRERSGESLDLCGVSLDHPRETARSLGAELVELDLSVPFTAERPRNSGFEHMLKVDPDNLNLWMGILRGRRIAGLPAKGAPDARSDVMVVYGRLRKFINPLFEAFTCDCTIIISVASEKINCADEKIS